MESDHKRYKDKIKKIKESILKKYIIDGGFEDQYGKKSIKIKIPLIQHPHFKEEFSDSEDGEGEGEGESGQEGQEQKGDSQGDVSGQEGHELSQGGGEEEGQENSQAGDKAGDQPGEHYIEINVTLDELIKELAKELELPNIKPTRMGNISKKEYKYNTVVPEGPRSRVMYKRTWREAMKRELTEHGRKIDLKKPFFPKIVNKDFRYRGAKEKEEPFARAVIFYMMDVSGSMGEHKKEIVRTESFWIDEWIRLQYKNAVDSRYIIHDTIAKEVERDEFFRSKEHGGTRISSAFFKANEIIEEEYTPFSSWNIYIFDFTDGENESSDNQSVIDCIEKNHLERSNQISVVQVGTPPYDSMPKTRYNAPYYNAVMRGFGPSLEEHFEKNEKVIVSYVSGKGDILDSIKQLLGKGK